MKYPRYPKYKPSGVEWLGDVPVHWNVLRLRFAIKTNPPKSEVAHIEVATPVSFIPMEAVGEYGGLNLETEKLVDEVGAGYTYFRDGDVVVAKITPCFENGKGALAAGLKNGIAFGTTELHVLRASESVENRFLFYLSISQPFRKVGEAEMYGAGGQKRVPEEFIRNLRPAIPPLNEQRAIAVFLDRETARIDALIAKKQQLIELLAEKRTALISQAVTKGLNPDAPMKDSGVEWLGEIPAHWEIKQLRHVGDAVIGLTYEPGDVVGPDDGVLVLRASNVFDGCIVLDDNVYVKRRIPERLVTRMGDILVCSRSGSRALIGKCAMIDQKSAGLSFGTFMTVFRSAYNSYLFYVFNSTLFEYQSGAFLTSTINQLTVANLYSFKTPIPPEDEQLEIVQYLKRETARLEALRAAVDSAIYKLKEFRAALIADAVTGEIDVRGLAEAREVA